MEAQKLRDKIALLIEAKESTHRTIFSMFRNDGAKIIDRVIRTIKEKGISAGEAITAIDRDFDVNLQND